MPPVHGGLVTLISSTVHGTFNVFIRNRMPPGMVALLTLQSSTMYGGIANVAKFHHSKVELEVTLEMKS